MLSKVANTARGRIVRIGLALLALPVAWIAMGVSQAGQARLSKPDPALLIRPYDTRVSAIRLERELGVPNPGIDVLDRAALLARQALSRDPTNIVAARSLALASLAHNDAATARRILGYAQSLSRRDLPTQLMLIEFSVQDGDVSGALEHYDIALRTNREAPRILYPVLAEALSIPDLITPIVGKINAGAPWGPTFVDFAVGTATSDAAVLRLYQLTSKTRAAWPQAVSGALVARLVKSGKYAEAAQVFDQYNPGVRQNIADGDFSRDHGMPPFDWQFTAQEDLTAEREAVDGSGNFVLSLSSSDGAAGELARQLLVLKPGTYRFEGAHGPNDPAGGPQWLRWAVRCDGQARDFVQGDIRLGASEGKFSAGFSVPAQSCGAQWLILSARTTSGAERLETWLDKLKVVGTP